MKFQIAMPSSLASRTADGRWKKLLVFLDSAFMPRPGEHYRFAGGQLQLQEPIDGSLLTVIDPLDGERWLYEGGKWERVGSLIA
jgi:hypothetical protein